MASYRASDEVVEREIAALQQIVQVRLRRYIAEMRDLDRDLRELKRERARRRDDPTAVAAGRASATA
ncbi:MAG: hypothetical protein L3K05_04900 [Thermoplasmata archaeon]|nr:hypothetical protein [Thermoplasmata archaeon]